MAVQQVATELASSESFNIRSTSSRRRWMAVGGLALGLLAVVTLVVCSSPSNEQDSSLQEEELFVTAANPETVVADLRNSQMSLMKRVYRLTRKIKRLERKKPIDVNVNWRPVGPQGRTGPKGSTGPRGQPGRRGPVGPLGGAGPRGRRGRRGPRGPVGNTGKTGVQGTTGPQGLHGPRGHQGKEGFRGPRGAAGPAGVPGKDGENGSNGVPGAQGRPGRPGLEGPQGASARVPLRDIRSRAPSYFYLRTRLNGFTLSSTRNGHSTRLVAHPVLGWTSQQLRFVNGVIRNKQGRCVNKSGPSGLAWGPCSASTPRFYLRRSGQVKLRGAGNKCLTVPNRSSGARVTLSACVNRSTRQKWFKVTQLESHDWRALKNNGVKCVAPAGNSQHTDRRLTTATCSRGSLVQQFRLSRSGQVVNRSGLCLNASTRAGGSVLTWACNNTTRQKWFFDSNGRLKSRQGGNLCLHRKETTSGSQLIMWRCNSSNDQKFALRR